MLCGEDMLFELICQGACAIFSFSRGNGLTIIYNIVHS